MAKYPTDTFEVLHWNMIRAHDTFKVGYDRITALLADPPKDDLANFLGYCSAWATAVEEHHDTEELTVFPFLNQKMDFSGELEQHKAMHVVLDKVIASIKASKADHSKFNAKELQNLMIEIKEPLFTHLDDEVVHIEAQKLKDAGIGEKELSKMLTNFMNHAKSNADPWIQVPFMKSHTTDEYRDIWPPMPWVLRKVVIPYMLAKRFSGYWKYSPYSVS